MKFQIVCGFTVLSLTVSAMTTVSVTGVSRNGATGAIEVSYSLTGDPAVVTFCGSTNGVPMADSAFKDVWGDVNCIVQPGDGSRKVSWMPSRNGQGFMVAPGDFSAGIKVWPTNAPPDYMVIDLITANCSYYASVECLPFPITNRLYYTDCLVFRKIPAAGVVWRMGSPKSEANRTSNYEKSRYIKLTSDYYIGVFELTARQVWYLCGQTDPYANSIADGAESIANLCGNLNLTKMQGYLCDDDVYMSPFSFACQTRIRDTKTPDSAHSWPQGEHAVKAPSFLHLARSKYPFLFDLPTDAEWEFAARGGEDLGCFTEEELRANAWCSLNSTMKLKNGEELKFMHRPGGKKANAYGLYDMLGNMYEHTLDWASKIVQDEAHPETVIENPKGPESDTDANNAQRIFRGGSFAEGARQCRAAFRKPHNQTWWDSACENTDGSGVNKMAGGVRLWLPAQAVR